MHRRYVGCHFDLAGALSPSFTHAALVLVLPPQVEVHVIPVTLEGHTRMQNSEGGGRDDDHGTFEDHECNLVVCQAAIESLRELSNTEDGADEDCQGCDSEPC
jgi:hypothetical protein